MELKNLHTVYFLGIGGIGMSALARYLHSTGIHVCGFDKTCTPLTLALESEGIQIHYTPDCAAVPEQTDIVVYTPAVPDDFEEWSLIRKRNLPVMKRSAMLAEIINRLPAIAVSGTHGKTTVTAMLAHTMESSGKPFVGFVGGVLCQYNTNVFIHRDAQWAIAEADEYDRSFLALKPFISIINAIDADHLDIYGKIESLHDSFSQFAAQTDPNGFVLVFDELAKEKLNLPPNTVPYGFSNQTGYSARNIQVCNEQFVCDVFCDNVLLHAQLRLPSAGRHNVQNAIAAFAALHLAGVSTDTIVSGLESFPGVKRRLELIAKTNTLTYYDDYAHHPAEIAALIDTIRELYPGKQITGIFQPHLFSRTRDFAGDFAEVLSRLDIPVITDIYPAREKPITGIDAHWLLSKIDNINKRYLPYDQIPSIVAGLHPGVLLTIGAGNIDAHVETLKNSILAR